MTDSERPPAGRDGRRERRARGRVPVEPSWPAADGNSPVSEFASTQQGAQSPFGEDSELPLPTDTIGYQHPRAADRPNR